MTRDETGQVLVLATGLALVCFSVAGVAIDGTRAFLARRALQNSADAIVISAAGEIDTDAYYRSGGSAVRVQPVRAERAAGRLLEQRALHARASLVVNEDQILVTMRSEIPTTFLKLVGVDAIPVAASAAAEPFPQELPIDA